MSERNALYQALRAPFPVEHHEFRIAHVVESSQRALCVVYVDTRYYMDRLDQATDYSWKYDMDVWEVAGRVVVQARVTLPDGREGVGLGEASPEDSNALATAEAQAFRRACVVLGLGRYLYHLPQFWAKVERRGNTWMIPDDELERLMKALQSALVRKANGKSSLRTANGDVVKRFQMYVHTLQKFAHVLDLVPPDEPPEHLDADELESYARTWRAFEKEIVHALGHVPGYSEKASPEARLKAIAQGLGVKI